MTETPRKTRSGSEKRQRQKRIAIRLTKEERALLSTRADSAGLTVGSFVRTRCLDGPAPRAIRRPNVDIAAIASVFGQLQKVGSNINQIARALNSGEPPPPDMETAFTELRTVADLMMKALEKKRRK